VISPVRTILFFAASLLLGAAFFPAPILSQSRNTFPGRRVGGGTRGECAARQIIHLVPQSSVFAPGSEGLIGWLEGPSSDPKPIEVSLRKQNTSTPVLSRSVASAGPRLVLLRLPQLLVLPLIWESGYQCADAPADDEFGFIGAEGPPAKSLLVADLLPADSVVQSHLNDVLNTCGSTASTATISRLFELEDVVSSRWPEVLPVVCL
jgi:hypothetical protein